MILNRRIEVRSTKRYFSTTYRKLIFKKFSACEGNAAFSTSSTHHHHTKQISYWFLFLFSRYSIIMSFKMILYYPILCIGFCVCVCVCVQMNWVYKNSNIGALANYIILWFWWFVGIWLMIVRVRVENYFIFLCRFIWDV